MYTPTFWENVRAFIRGVLCRHKHIEIRTVRTGSEGEEMKVLGKFRYCLDCKNSGGWL